MLARFSGCANNRNSSGSGTEKDPARRFRRKSSFLNLPFGSHNLLELAFLLARMFLLRVFPTRWHIARKLWELVRRLEKVPEIAVESIVIPSVGREYVEEAKLSAQFAYQNVPDVKEIIVATDLNAEAFTALPPKTRIETVCVSGNSIPANSPYRQIWSSRLIKLRAPTLAKHRVVLMIDSDLLLLRDFRVALLPGVLYGSLHRGKIGHRMKKHLRTLPELRRAPRLQRKFHVNGGLLLAELDTWKRLSTQWTNYYCMVWKRLPEEVPVDQIPLVMALDNLGIHTVDLGPFVNWSVPKKLGGLELPLPPEVIGAHGGFPLEEWNKYLADPSASLKFRGEDYTRKARYQKNN